MHTYTDSRGFPPARFAPSSRAYLVWLMSISEADKIRDFDDNFGEEYDNYESDVDDKGGLFTII